MDKPTLREAVNRFCLACKSNDVWAIGNCETEDCQLHPVRPNQALKGKQPLDYDLEELQQSALDALHLVGLKGKPYV